MIKVKLIAMGIAKITMVAHILKELKLFIKSLNFSLKKQGEYITLCDFLLLGEKNGAIRDAVPKEQQSPNCLWMEEDQPWLL